MTLIRIGLAALMALCALSIPASAKEQDKEKDQTSGKQTPTVWTIPDIDALPDDARGQLVRRGRDLITMTYAYIGPHAPDRDMRFAGNNLACGNCHLDRFTGSSGISHAIARGQALIFRSRTA